MVNFLIIFFCIIFIGIISIIIFLKKRVYYFGPVSNHFTGERFFNLNELAENDSSQKLDFFTIIKFLIAKFNNRWEKKTVEKQNCSLLLRSFSNNDLRILNIGHATFLIQVAGVNILTDPVWSKRVSPFKFIGPKRYIAPGIDFSDLPKIDLVWISHNHYDHLDLKTIERIWFRDKPRIIVPLGNDRIIRLYNKDIISEAYDWYDVVEVNNDLKLHLSPVQHWSSRWVIDKNKALWSALVIETFAGNIYFTGDSGYGRYFKDVKEKFGSFRLALIPMGAYKPRNMMEYSHMGPKELVKAYFDLGMPVTVPCHYDVFNLANENQGEALSDLKEIISSYGNHCNNIKIMQIGEFALIPKN